MPLRSTTPAGTASTDQAAADANTLIELQRAILIELRVLTQQMHDANSGIVGDPQGYRDAFADQSGPVPI